MARIRTADRSNLTISDLKARQPASTKLMNIQIPVQIADAISRLANQLGTTKTEIIIGLLNAGLEKAGKLQVKKKKK